MYRYIAEEDHVQIDAAQTFSDLLVVALRILERMPKPLVQISGPITTGGAGSEEENCDRICMAKRVLNEKGYHVFDYMIFQDALKKIIRQYPGDQYCMEMLEIFFRGLFESGHISTVFFLPDWETSTGARWERQIVTERGLEIVDMPIEWLSEVPS